MMHVLVGVEVRLEQVEVERAVVGVEGAGLQAREHGRAALLVFDDVRLRVQKISSPGVVWACSATWLLMVPDGM